MKTFQMLIISLGLALLATQASASDAYLHQQARELESLSREIARELRYSGEHRALRREAEELALEASRFRDAIDGRYERVYIQSRYDTLSRHYRSLDRRYREVHFEPRYRYLDRSFISIGAIFGDLDIGYVRYTRDWDFPYYSSRSYSSRPIIVTRPAPRYAPFGLQQRDRRDDRGYERRPSNDRHSSRSRHDSDDRGRRNHYK
ncbi:MAG: hypothetical protein H7A06_01795 [Pseudomonadales bacterium]|nr:hypothetical protein [Pseudomonadales bacterium]